MRRRAFFFAAALALLSLAGGSLLFPHGEAEIALVAPFESFPATLKGWTGSNHAPQDVLPMDPRVPEHLFRSYHNGPQTVWVSVGYYPSQEEGRRPPAQDLLFPSHGWSALTARPVRIPLDEPRSIPANLLVMRTADRRVVILYWYQIQRRSIASDHWYRAILLFNRLVRRRSDGALVRIAAPVPDRADPGAVVGGLNEFIQAFYPELVRILPP